MKKLIFLVLVIGIILVVYLSQYLPEIIVSPNNQTNIPDPSATYCKESGYEFKIVTNPDGSQYGVCKLSVGLECDSWKFFQGKCGKEYTFCEKHGGTIITRNTSCRFSSECSICVLPNGIECDEWNYLKGECP